MPSYTLDEMRDQAYKTAHYFERGMQGFARDFIAVASGATTVVVATGDAADRLNKFVESGGVGKVTAGVEDVNKPAAPVLTASSAPAEASGEGNEPDAEAAVVLIPMFHAPPPEHAHKGGNIHLHVLNDAKIGRRVRASGECLCSKKHGSSERVPVEGETNMCGECVKVAADAGIAWSLL